MFNNINRHILIGWQSIGILVGSLVSFTFVEKGILSLEMAVIFIQIFCFWYLLHVFDASAWYNRNQAIITNIEREFLFKEDLVRIHFLFGEHRESKMLRHFRIQLSLGFCISISILAYHFFTRVVPGFSLSLSNFKFINAAPYLLLWIFLIYLNAFQKSCKDKQDDFIKRSPGRDPITLDSKD